jgi:penicillin-binding protein 2
MHKFFIRKLKKKIKRKYQDINPEDIFLDATNLPGYTENTFAGRIEKPMGSSTFLIVRVFLLLVLTLFVFKLWGLEVSKGKLYAEISENNRLGHTVIFANRGVIYDRNHLELATNAVKSEESDYSARVYSDLKGLSHVVGYLKYPSQDSQGFYYDEEYKGKDGVELAYNDLIKGKNGLKLTETDVHGNITSESVIDKPEDGKPIVLSVDAKLSDELYKAIEDNAKASNYLGGAGVIMDVRTGEIIAMVSYPEYDSNVLTSGKDSVLIKSLLNDPGKPFINRVVSGLYTPGSILKPIVALAALNEGIITPEKKILSTGSITVPNPYDPSKPSIFKDWKAHGWVDMREALAVSSDVYFYEIGGGYPGQKGLGIENIDRYFKLFGLNEKTGIILSGEGKGVIPTPEWKSLNFDGDDWRLGDTYNTSIGQYGTQITMLEEIRYISAVANGGKLLKPSLIVGGEEDPVVRTVEFNPKDWQVVKEGMRLGVVEGTSAALNIPAVKVAAKTGTAQVGAGNKFINSWSVGFFPYDNPKYAFVILLERGPSTNTMGATPVTRELLDWMALYKSEYFN